MTTIFKPQVFSLKEFSLKRSFKDKLDYFLSLKQYLQDFKAHAITELNIIEDIEKLDNKLEEKESAFLSELEDFSLNLSESTNLAIQEPNVFFDYLHLCQSQGFKPSLFKNNLSFLLKDSRSTLSFCRSLKHYLIQNPEKRLIVLRSINRLLVNERLPLVNEQESLFDSPRDTLDFFSLLYLGVPFNSEEKRVNTEKDSEVSSFSHLAEDLHSTFHLSLSVFSDLLLGFSHFWKSGEVERQSSKDLLSILLLSLNIKDRKGEKTVVSLYRKVKDILDAFMTQVCQKKEVFNLDDKNKILSDKYSFWDFETIKSVTAYFELTSENEKIYTQKLEAFLGLDSIELIEQGVFDYIYYTSEVERKILPWGLDEKFTFFNQYLKDKVENGVFTFPCSKEVQGNLNIFLEERITQRVSYICDFNEKTLLKYLQTQLIRGVEAEFNSSFWSKSKDEQKPLIHDLIYKGREVIEVEEEEFDFAEDEFSDDIEQAIKKAIELEQKALEQQSYLKYALALRKYITTLLVLEEKINNRSNSEVLDRLNRLEECVVELTKEYEAQCYFYDEVDGKSSLKQQKLIRQSEKETLEWIDYLLDQSICE